MNVEELLDQLDDMMEKGWSFPGGRRVIDVEKIRAVVDDIRLNMPTEIKQAKSIVSDRADIITTAKKEAEGIVRSAEERARAIVAQEEITKMAQAKPTKSYHRRRQKVVKCAKQRRSLWMI